jgi:hypothetical protein
VGTDYLAASGVLVLPAGQTSATILLSVVGDRLNELDEMIFLNLSQPVGVLLSDTQGVVTIANNDPLPSLTVNDVKVVEGNTGTKNLAFTVSLSAPSGQAVSVQYATADATAISGSDYVAKSGTLTFFAGTSSQTINVSINGDADIESDETLLFQLFSPTNAVIEDAQGVGTILGDDEAGESATATAIAAGLTRSGGESANMAGITGTSALLQQKESVPGRNAPGNSATTMLEPGLSVRSGTESATDSVESVRRLLVGDQEHLVMIDLLLAEGDEGLSPDAWEDD